MAACSFPIFQHKAHKWLENKCLCLELAIPIGTSQQMTCMAQHTAGRDEVAWSEKWSDLTADWTMPNLQKLHSWKWCSQSAVSAPPSSLWTSRARPVLPSISSPCVPFPHLLSFPCCNRGWEQLLLQGFLQSLEPVWHNPPECLVHKSLLFSWTPDSAYFQKRLLLKTVIYHWDKKIWKQVKASILILIS